MDVQKEFVKLNEKMDLIIELLYQSNENIKTVTTDDHIRIDECSKITGLAPTTIRTKACRGELPFYKQGKFLAFSRSVIMDWIKSGKPTTTKIN